MSNQPPGQPEKSPTPKLPINVSPNGNAEASLLKLIDGITEWQTKADSRKKAEAIAEANAIREQEQIQQERSAKARSTPVFGQDACVCPRCDVFAQHSWYPVEYDRTRKATGNSANLQIPNGLESKSIITVKEAFFQICSHCKELSLWNQRELILPLPNPPGPTPLKEAPKIVRELHEEARAICQQSPRGAAALLRLALDELLGVLGFSEGDLAVRLKEAKKEKVLSSKIYDAALAVKLLGDNSVHLGVIDLHKTPVSSSAMMEFLNLLVQETIVKDQRIAAVLKQGSDAKAASKRKQQ